MSAPFEQQSVAGEDSNCGIEAIRNPNGAINSIRLRPSPAATYGAWVGRHKP